MWGYVNVVVDVLSQVYSQFRRFKKEGVSLFWQLAFADRYIKIYFGSKGPSFKEKFSGKSISDKFDKLFRKKINAGKNDNFGLDSGIDYAGVNQLSLNESSMGMKFDSSDNSQTQVKITLDYANDGFEGREAGNLLENVLDWVELLWMEENMIFREKGGFTKNVTKTAKTA